MAEQVKEFASMSEVVMKKDELLKALVENKARHDALFEAAVAGYWETAKTQLEEKQKHLTVALAEFKEDADTQINRTLKKVESHEALPARLEVRGFAWSSSLALVFPENHTKDYERAIRMMNSSIYDEVKLSENEFDQYVLNNWEWKSRFITSNSNYLSNAPLYFSGCSGVVGASGPIGTTGAFYSVARNDTFEKLKAGGVNNVTF